MVPEVLVFCLVRHSFQFKLLCFVGLLHLGSSLWFALIATFLCSGGVGILRSYTIGLFSSLLNLVCFGRGASSYKIFVANFSCFLLGMLSLELPQTALYLGRLLDPHLSSPSLWESTWPGCPRPYRGFRLLQGSSGRTLAAGSVPLVALHTGSAWGTTLDKRATETTGIVLGSGLVDDPVQWSSSAGRLHS